MRVAHGRWICGPRGARRGGSAVARRFLMRVAVAAVGCLSVVLAFGPAVAQEPLGRVSLDDALQLALRQNPTLRAQQFALESTKAGQVTAALRPNPTMNFLAEQFGGGSASQTQYTVNVGQPIELGGKRQRRIDSALAPTPVAGDHLHQIRPQTILPAKA